MTELGDTILLEDTEVRDSPHITADNGEGKLFEVQRPHYDRIELQPGSTFNFNQYKPLFDAETVVAEIGPYGAKLGELLAKVELPQKHSWWSRRRDQHGKSDAHTIYVFKLPNVEGKHALEEDTTPEYLIIGDIQLRAAKEGQDILTEQHDSISVLGEREKCIQIIGRENWMPGFGALLPTTAAAKAAFRERFEAVSRNHGSFSIGESGQLQLTTSVSENSLNPTTIIMKPDRPVYAV